MCGSLPDLFVIGLLALIGFYAGKAVKILRLPSIIGYMIVGVLAGPSLLDWCDEAALGRFGFINEVALGLVAFTIGSELSLRELKKLGNGIIAIIFAESFGAFLIVFAGIYLLANSMSAASAVAVPLALIFASMAPASAPAGTVAVIQEYKAKGKLTTALYAVVGFDDGLAIFIFGFAAAVAKSILIGRIDPAASMGLADTLLVPAKEIVFSILAGGVLGVLFCNLARRVKNPRELFILIIAFVLIGCGLSEMFHLSLILTNLVIGFVLVNTRSDDLVHQVAEQVGGVMPFIFILFFLIAGAHLKISALASLGTIGLVYIITRTAGLILGSRIGAMIGHVEEKIKKYIGLGILSQAGVAIGLALIVNAEFGELAAKAVEAGKLELAEEIRWIGSTVITSITATCIFFEVIGPIGAKIALTRAGEINQAK
jgi:Kef-type K+ transport system membrane component KefB